MSCHWTNSQVELQLSISPVGQSTDDNPPAFAEPAVVADALSANGSIVQALPAPLLSLKWAGQ